MKNIEVITRLSDAAPNSQEAVALVRDLLDEARNPARLAIQRYLPAQGEMAAKGMSVLDQLGELALVPAAEAAPMTDAQKEVWLLRFMKESFLDLRKRALSSLAGQLEHGRLLPPAPPGSPHPNPPDARVCDLAFIILERMMRDQPSPGSFLGRPMKDRDAQIKSLKESTRFKEFTES
jgi:hypothetical protein